MIRFALQLSSMLGLVGDGGSIRNVGSWASHGCLCSCDGWLDVMMIEFDEVVMELETFDNCRVRGDEEKRRVNE